MFAVLMIALGWVLCLDEADYLKANWWKLIILAPLAFLIGGIEWLKNLIGL